MANLNLASLAANHSVPLKSGNACPFPLCSSLQWLCFFSGFSFSVLGVCWMGSLRNPAAGAPGLSGWTVCVITSYQNTGNTSALNHWCSKWTLSLQTVTEKRLKVLNWLEEHPQYLLTQPQEEFLLLSLFCGCFSHYRNREGPCECSSITAEKIRRCVNSIQIEHPKIMPITLWLGFKSLGAFLEHLQSCKGRCYGLSLAL